MVETDATSLYMFYGLLNIPTLEQVFNKSNLRARAVAIQCDGWCRAFGTNYATIQPCLGASLKVYGVYLTPEEVALMNQDRMMADAVRMGNRKMRIDLNTNAAGGSGLRIM